MRRPIGRFSHLHGRQESCTNSAKFCTCCSAIAGVFQRINSLPAPFTRICCALPMAYQRFVMLLRFQSKPTLRLWLPRGHSAWFARCSAPHSASASRMLPAAPGR